MKECSYCGAMYANAYGAAMSKVSAREWAKRRFCSLACSLAAVAGTGLPCVAEGCDTTARGQSAYCNAHRQKAWKAANPDRARALRVRHGQASPANRARHTVSYSVKVGKLRPLPCEVCAEPNAEAHHPFGYAKEFVLAVWWLCRTHHSGVHSAMRQTA